MKFAIAALLGIASAASLKNQESPDCPASGEVFAYHENMPSAAGFVQLSACSQSGINGAGLTCVPDHMFFATGMNGDEDLGQDIIMKGKPFHYNQKLAQEAPEEGSAAEEKAEAKEDEKMKEAEAKAKKAANAPKQIGAPEKVSVLETEIAK